MLVYALPQIGYEAVRRGSTILPSLNIAIDRVVFRKLIAVSGLAAVVAIGLYFAQNLGLARWAPITRFLEMAWPVLLILAVPYMCTVHALQQNQKDEFFHMGSLLVGDLSIVDWSQIKHFVLSWTIKLFFIPIMFWELNMAIQAVDTALRSNTVGQLHAYQMLVAVIYFWDLCIAATGYFATLRLFGWQIRSCSPYPIAWLVTLICYYPFYGFLYRAFLNYDDDGYYWTTWLDGSPILLAIWGTAILALKFTWIWSNAPFGLLFSNLTNRGIVTDGAFRFSKHPSYISKNMFWWLIAVPFVSPAGISFAVENSLQLAAIGLIYFFRAKYEELHLSEEPRYVQYADWIEENGIFRWVGRLIPIMRCWRPPESDSPSPK
ncbi:hypothetical protein G5V57_10745 [Nordella sp. HKS 07]|uniref:isoprenylcysteine carboxylmethyltransferase family protein n=1 Tax=Nordella sp. HKS 07 TaxID=2712222 RepID=UPI0013E19A33|nr:isoprenylcysteine carboxylmethyltransferase family protein [Nordella sp. HKS 07]QIG48159.1 hypothetical protein G5V57_10745 [Nordella sp. HKS 07]